MPTPEAELAKIAVEKEFRCRAVFVSGSVASGKLFGVQISRFIYTFNLLENPVFTRAYAWKTKDGFAVLPQGNGVNSTEDVIQSELDSIKKSTVL